MLCVLASLVNAAEAAALLRAPAECGVPASDKGNYFTRSIRLLLALLGDYRRHVIACDVPGSGEITNLLDYLKWRLPETYLVACRFPGTCSHEGKWYTWYWT